jgi:hypothetical protein
MSCKRVQATFWSCEHAINSIVAISFVKKNVSEHERFPFGIAAFSASMSTKGNNWIFIGISS